MAPGELMKGCAGPLHIIVGPWVNDRGDLAAYQRPIGKEDEHLLGQTEGGPYSRGARKTLPVYFVTDSPGAPLVHLRGRGVRGHR